MKKYIIDTNILMSLQSLNNLIEHCGGTITVPIYVIEELDNLKSKEGMKGYQARRALRNLGTHKEQVDFYLPVADADYYIPHEWDRQKVDNKLIGYTAFIHFGGVDTAALISNDLNVRIKCDAIGVPTESYNEQNKFTSGWVEINLTEQEYFTFEESKHNYWDVPVNNYLIIKSMSGEEIYGIYKNCGEGEWEEVKEEKIGCYELGSISPKDAYQQCAINSLLNDDFTVLTGHAGTGKTLLSLTYCLRQIHSGAREKLIIFTNPVKVRGSEALGFYKGDRTDKLLQNSIGAMLSSKLGGQFGVEMWMQQGKVEILPISDIRGFEVGPKQIMYITEAQNLDKELLKLAIQRCASGSKIILEGDPYTQVDHYAFEGDNNGLNRVIEVFEGYYGFSHIQLPIIYRSMIADKAEEM